MGQLRGLEDGRSTHAGKEAIDGVLAAQLRVARHRLRRRAEAGAVEQVACIALAHRDGENGTREQQARQAWKK